MGSLSSRGSAQPEGLSPEEVEKHNTKGDAWLILFGEAIDVTKFLPIHPGGEESIEAYLGKDASEAWVEIHTAETLEKNLHLMKKMGKMQERGGLVSWLLQRMAGKKEDVGTSKVLNSMPTLTVQASTTTSATDQSEGLKWAPEHDAQLPESGVFTLDTLARWNGVQLPMCIALCGIVIDVSPSENFVPNFGYGKLWAGRDCTLAMATVSLKAQVANRLDFKLEDLEEMQFKSLGGWYKHFTEKYRQVGTLLELQDRDFSSVREAAEEMKKAALPS
mmetsp:Transcript_68660/g.110665  ORF Transcript_68660/g.110665 Transcript_68660/m.110665 type:complete len:276 (+) Transcript_68660:55-882(+)